MIKTWKDIYDRGDDYNVSDLDTIAASSLAAISIWSISVITVSYIRVESFSISSGFDPNDVIGSAPDVTWNSNWSTRKSIYSFPGGLLENSAGPHGKPCWSVRIWMDLNRWINNYKRYLMWNLRRWNRCSCQRRCCYSNHGIYSSEYEPNSKEDFKCVRDDKSKI